jgi:hypothetical protein
MKADWHHRKIHADDTDFHEFVPVVLKTDYNDAMAASQ